MSSPLHDVIPPLRNRGPETVWAIGHTSFLYRGCTSSASVLPHHKNMLPRQPQSVSWADVVGNAENAARITISRQPACVYLYPQGHKQGGLWMLLAQLVTWMPHAVTTLAEAEMQPPLELPIQVAGSALEDLNALTLGIIKAIPSDEEDVSFACLRDEAHRRTSPPFCVAAHRGSSRAVQLRAVLQAV